MESRAKGVCPALRMMEDKMSQLRGIDRKLGGNILRVAGGKGKEVMRKRGDKTSKW